MDLYVGVMDPFCASQCVGMYAYDCNVNKNSDQINLFKWLIARWTILLDCVLVTELVSIFD